jgi:hypothetical protein
VFEYNEDQQALADAAGADLPPACLDCSGCANPRPTGIAPKVGFSVARILRAAGPPPVPDSVRGVVEEEVLRALQGL